MMRIYRMVLPSLALPEMADKPITHEGIQQFAGCLYREQEYNETGI